MRLALYALSVAILVACSSTPRAPFPTSAPAATPVPPTPRPATSTPVPPTPRPATATPAPDYRGMRTRLLTPLGGLIVSMQGDRVNAAGHLANFNIEADKILPVIALDMSKPANALHSAIVNVRAHPGDLQNLEEVRRNLLADIP